MLILLGFPGNYDAQLLRADIIRPYIVYRDYRLRPASICPICWLATVGADNIRPPSQHVDFAGLPGNRNAMQMRADISRRLNSRNSPSWGDCSFSPDLTADEIPATGGHRRFVRPYIVYWNNRPYPPWNEAAA